MKKIEDLLKDDHRVWFYLRNERIQKQFVEEVTELGGRYLNGDPVTTESCASIMTVHPDLKVAHVSWMVWDASFTPSFPERYVGDASKIRRVDYERYVTGESDYLIERRKAHDL